MKVVGKVIGDDVERIFDHIATGPWIENEWESISGPGSTLAYTDAFRSSLANFLRLFDCKSLLDAPCGDFNWMKEVKMPESLRYFGADIVSSIVSSNVEQYSDANRLFMKLNIITDPIPDADAWLCRDCLFHLSLDHALKALRNGSRSSIKYYLLTSHFNEVNIDIETGSFRELNLEKKPFDLPRPIASMLDYVEGWPARQVGVWTKDQLLGALVSQSC